MEGSASNHDTTDRALAPHSPAKAKPTVPSPVAKEKIAKGTKIMKKETKSRGGSPNYKAEEIERLLDAVADIQPLGANDWALVEQQFNNSADPDDIALTRDQDSLKKKFDKMAATKKSTGDPSCPPHIRRAKHIARDIVGRASAGIVGDSSDEAELASGADGDGSHPAVGSRKRGREMGARGIKKRRTDGDELVRHVETMSDAVTELVKCMVGERNEVVDQVSIDARVEATVKREMEDTKKLIQEQKNVLEELKDMFLALNDRRT